MLVEPTFPLSFIVTLQRHFYPKKGRFSPKKQPPAEYSTYTSSEVKLL